MNEAKEGEDFSHLLPEGLNKGVQVVKFCRLY